MGFKAFSTRPDGRAIEVGLLAIGAASPFADSTLGWRARFRRAWPVSKNLPRRPKRPSSAFPNLCGGVCPPPGARRPAWSPEGLRRAFAIQLFFRYLTLPSRFRSAFELLPPNFPIRFQLSFWPSGNVPEAFRNLFRTLTFAERKNSIQKPSGARLP